MGFYNEAWNRYKQVDEFIERAEGLRDAYNKVKDAYDNRNGHPERALDFIEGLTDGFKQIPGWDKNFVTRRIVSLIEEGVRLGRQGAEYLQDGFKRIEDGIREGEGTSGGGYKPRETRTLRFLKMITETGRYRPDQQVIGRKGSGHLRDTLIETGKNMSPKEMVLENSSRRSR